MIVGTRGRVLRQLEDSRRLSGGGGGGGGGGGHCDRVTSTHENMHSDAATAGALLDWAAIVAFAAPVRPQRRHRHTHTHTYIHTHTHTHTHTHIHTHTHYYRQGERPSRKAYSK